MDKQREEFEKAFKNNNAYNIELIHGTNTPTFEKNSKGEYLKISVQNHWEMWQQAQKVAVPVLTNKMICAIENTVEDQLIASGITSDPFRLDGEKIYQAMIEAQES